MHPLNTSDAQGLMGDDYRAVHCPRKHHAVPETATLDFALQARLGDVRECGFRVLPVERTLSAAYGAIFR